MAECASLLLCQLWKHVCHCLLTVQTIWKSATVDVSPLIFSLQNWFGRSTSQYLLLEDSSSSCSDWTTARHSGFWVCRSIIFTKKGSVIHPNNGWKPVTPLMDGRQTDDLCWSLKCEPAQFAVDRDGWLSAPDIDTRWGMPGMSRGQTSWRGRKVKVSSDWTQAVLYHANIFGYIIHLIKEEMKVGTLEGKNSNFLACWSLLIGLCTPVIVLFPLQKCLCLRCVQLLWCYCCQETQPKHSLSFSVISPISIAGHTFGIIARRYVIPHKTTPLSTLTKPVHRPVCAGPVELDCNIRGNILSMGAFGFPYNSSLLANA